MSDDATPKFIANTYGTAVRAGYDTRKNNDRKLDFYAKSDSNAGIQNRKSLHKAKSKRFGFSCIRMVQTTAE